MGNFLRFLLFLPLLTSCGSNEVSSHQRHEYSEIIDYHISYLDVFNQPHETYYVYYYQVNCYHCHGIKSKVIEYAIHSSIPFYFVKIEKDEGFLSHSKEETIGATDPYYAFSMMTPQLSLVYNQSIKETYIGMDEVLNIIE